MAPPNPQTYMGNVAHDTTDTGIKYYRKRKKKKKTNVGTKETTFHDWSSSALIGEISQPFSCNTPGTWYEVLLSVLPLVSSTATVKNSSF